MSNVHKSIAVSILRNIVTSVFKVSPREVQLMEHSIDPEYQGCDSYLYGGMWDDKSTDTLYGFSPETGFVTIPEVIFSQWNSQDGPSQDDKDQHLKLYEVNGVDKYVFFLVYNESEYDCPSNSQHNKVSTWKLYKSPNFQSYWDKIEKEDLTRWEQWLG
jgi:hypothetical protein